MIIFSHNVENAKGFQDKIAQNRAKVDRLAKGRWHNSHFSLVYSQVLLI